MKIRIHRSEIHLDVLLEASDVATELLSLLPLDAAAGGLPGHREGRLPAGQAGGGGR
ncbi:hypothetical protein LRH25_14135 [Ideonella azotifigens]|uniref:hypothetical protein n=1 Tax=Ideonella TaxID=36862 RepID=UPI001B88679C|nr:MULTISPECIES: hypothetical protein [Ideonella]MCD2341478.1 hypothetical protein [Ideonella azotifigens]HSI47121.1 hypothetical protein [Ideonella sp.]